jgi:hypothetical protein
MLVSALTNSMEQSPSWETDSHSASQEIPRLLCNPKVHYRVHWSLLYINRLIFVTGMRCVFWEVGTEWTKLISWGSWLKELWRAKQATKLTDCMQQSPSWEADSHSASQEIPRLLRNLKVHYHVYKSKPMVSILSQTNPVHNFPTYFHNIYSNIIFPSTPTSSEWSLPFRFSELSFVCNSHLYDALYMDCSSHTPWCDRWTLYT